MSAKASSTIGFEKQNNPILGTTEEHFKETLTESFPERPKSFSHIIQTNKNGPPLLDRCPMVTDMSPYQVKNSMAGGAILLDTRDTASFGGAHIPGSINIGLTKQTANWIGMVIEPGADIILLVENDQAYDDMCTQLHRIGYDNILGYLYGGITAWQEEGLPISQLWQISADKLEEKLAANNYGSFLDVRTPAERSAGYIQGSRHYPLTRLLTEPPDLPKDEEMIVFCGIGYRGNIAASYLQREGFSHVHSLAGGIKAGSIPDGRWTGCKPER